MPLKTHVDEQPSLNLTSMIDVLFLLIIFFMAGTKFTELERNIGVTVPKVKDSPNLSQTQSPHVVTVFRDGSLSLNRDLVTLDQLMQSLSAIQQTDPQASVILRGDADGTLQRVAEVLAACREAGITNLGFSVRMAKREVP